MTNLSLDSSVSNATLFDLISTSLNLKLINHHDLDVLGISLSSLRNLSERSPELHLINIWRLIEKRKHGAGVGVAIGSVINNESKGVLASWVSQTESIREALSVFINNVSLMGPSEKWFLNENGPDTQLTMIMDTDRYPAIAIERSMSAMVIWGRALTGINYQIKRATFSFSAPDELDCFHDVFGLSLQFDSQENSLTIDSRFLDQRLVSGNVFLKEVIEGQAKQLLTKYQNKRSLSMSVKDVITKRLKSNSPVTSNDVAAALSMSRQSLHRKLKQENTTFTQLLDISRADLARELLRDQARNIAAISLELGYKDTSSFYKAFHRWFGMSPRQLRENGLNQSSER